MKARDFIEAFREGKKLRNGNLEIDDGYFQQFAEFNVPVNIIEMGIEGSDIVRLGSGHGDTEMWYLNIVTTRWEVSE